MAEEIASSGVHNPKNSNKPAFQERYLFSIIGLKSIRLPLRERQGELPPTGMSLFQVFVRGFQRC